RIDRDLQKPLRIGRAVLALHENDTVDASRSCNSAQVLENEVPMDPLQVWSWPGEAILPQTPQMRVGIDHARAAERLSDCAACRERAANAAITTKQTSGTTIAKRICPVLSDTRPIRFVNTAPPMIAMTINDEPSLVRSPRPRIDAAKIVGNMMDMKKLAISRAAVPTVPPTATAIAQSTMLTSP